MTMAVDGNPSIEIAVTGRLLSMAAATAPATSRAAQVQHAAAAGFDAVGLRIDLDLPDVREIGEISAMLNATGTVLLDVEVVRIGSHDSATIAAIADVVAALQPRFLLAVSDLADEAATVDALAALAGVIRPTGTLVAVEFMAFTEIRTLADALRIVEATGVADIGVLVDPLHLRRSGGQPGDLDGIDPARLPYVQLCDAPLAAPANGLAGIVDEARHARRLPGLGELPLADLLRRIPDVPISVEVHDDAARRMFPPAELARRAAERTRRWLGEQISQ